MPKANRDIVIKNTPNWAIAHNEEEGNNTAKFMNHELAILKYSTEHLADFTDYDSIVDVISFYMNQCAQDDVKPNFVGLCCALRCSKKVYISAMNGVTKSDPAVRELLQQMMTFMEYQLNLSITESKQNPLGSIFLLKNHHNYSDKNELLVNGSVPAVEEQTDEQLKAKYMENVIDISDDE